MDSTSFPGLLYTLIIIIIHAEFGRVATLEHCSEAFGRCTLNLGCYNALINLQDNCLETENRCKKSCIYSIVSLIHTFPALSTCNSSQNELYSVPKKKLEVCEKKVEKTLKTLNNDHLPCALSLKLCEAETRCSTALFYYRKNCQRLFRKKGISCQPACKRSAKILYSTIEGYHLRRCKCKGQNKDRIWCEIIQNNMENFCGLKRIRKTSLHTTPILDLTIENGQSGYSHGRFLCSFKAVHLLVTSFIVLSL